MLSSLSPDGRCLVVGHGSVVWIATRSQGLAPAAVLELPDEVVAVAASARRVFALTRAGVLVVSDRHGDELGRDELGAEGVDLMVRGTHTVAFTRRGFVRSLAPGQHTDVEIDGVVAGAVAPDGRVAVVLEGGPLRLFDATDGVERELESPEPLHRIVPSTWHEGGDLAWFAVSEDEVFVVPPGRDQCFHVTSTGDQKIRHLAAAPDGRMLALALGEKMAVVLTLPERDTVGQVSYVDRRIVGLDFGPDDVLALGMDQGDGNWFDLRTLEIVRTDPPEGEARRHWMVEAGANLPEERSAESESAPSPDSPPVAAPRTPGKDRRPPPPQVDRSTIDHVRRCASCGKPAAVPLSQVFVRRMGITTNAVAQTDYRCQECGTPFTLQSMAEVKAVFAAILGLPLLGITSLWLGMPFATMSESTEPLRWVMVGLIGLVVIGGWGAVIGFGRPLWTKIRHPKVDGAPVPALRYPRAHRLRRSSAGAWAQVTKVEATTINGIRMGTDLTYTCHESGEEFTIVTPFSMFVMGAVGLVLTPFVAVALFGLVSGADLTTLCCAGVPGAIGLFGLGYALTGARDRWLRHPEDRDEPPLEL